MNAKPKKKLCWNCEGATSFEEANCSYCGVYLHPLSTSETESENDLFSPPYKLSQEEQRESSNPASPFKTNDSTEHLKTNSSNTAPLNASTSDFHSSPLKETILPLFLLIGGSLFFIFGLALMFFAKDGVLTLQWNGDYWFLYLFLSIPMLFFGWIALQHISEDQSE